MTLFINFFWKISAHTVSMGAALGAFVGLHNVLMVDLLWLIVATILLAGIVGFARLRAGKHTQSQIYWGYMIGFTLMYLLIRYY